MFFSPLLVLKIFMLFITMAVAFVGWGAVLGKLCKIPFSVCSEKEEKILMGIFCLYLLAGICNFFFPINKYFSCGFLLSGVFFFFCSNKICVKNIDFFAIFLSFFFIMFSFSPVISYDSYLYHTDTIRWINEHAVVPGLANLHSRLGFNQFFFYIPAVCETLLPGKGWSVANPFLAWIMTCCFWNAQKKSEQRILALLACGCISAYGFYTEILSSPSPDCFSDFLQLFILCSLVWYLKERQSGRFIFFMLLSVVAVLTKFSNSFLCIIALIIIFILEKDKKYILVHSLPLSFLLWTIWCTRSVFLTGYMLYPISWPNFNVDWKLPAEILQKEQDGITGWARLPGEHYITAAHSPISYWIKNWILNKLLYVFQKYLNMSIIGFLLLYGIKGKKIILEQWLIVLTVFLSIFSWFMTAPDPRFIQGILFFILIYPFALLIPCHLFSGKQSFILPCVFVLFFVPCGQINYLKSILIHEFASRSWRKYNIKYTKSRLAVSYVPDCDGGSGPLSGIQPLPATPYFNYDLVLRGTNIQSGFRIAPSDSDSKVQIIPKKEGK